MSDQAEPPGSIGDKDTTDTPREMRPLNAPRPGALVQRNRFTVAGPDFHSSNDEKVKLHLYARRANTDRNEFVAEMVHTLIPTVVPFTTVFNKTMPAWVADRASAYFLYQFVQKNGDESYWYDSGWFEIATPPYITSHVSGQTQDVVRPTLSGTAPGLAGLLVRAVKQVSPSSVIFLSNVATVGSNGAWSLPLTQDLVDGNNEITIRMWLANGVESSDVSTTFIYYLLPNAIITPLPANGFIRGPRTDISGTGVSGSQVDLHKSGDGVTVYGTATVQTGNTWRLTPTRDLPQGAYQLTAKQRKDGKTRTWSTAVTVFGLFPLTITSPPSLQESAFMLSGTGGLAGAQVVVYQDRADTIYGRGTVLANGSWSIALSGLPPGTLGLTALQTQSGYTADRSSPVIFKIRPPQLGPVTSTPLPNQQLTLSGSGYNGATVEFTYVSGSGAQTIPPVTVVNGVWQTSVRDWVPGTYTFSVTQKVSDGAGGWIISQPSQFTITWQVPDPFDVTYTVADYTPTFFGGGYTGAMVEIFRQGGAVAAPDAPVVNARWSSPSAQVWGPTDRQIVHLRQRLNELYSLNWVEVVVTIPPLAPVITSLVETGLSPTITGTCWPGAVVNLVYSDSATVYHPVVTGGTWTFRRATDFAPGVTHTVTVTQTAASQTSPSVRQTFTVARTLLKPVITAPGPDAEVGRDWTVQGRDGIAGASMQLRDAQFGRPLGSPKILTSDGHWEISLTGLEFRMYQVDARQSLDSRDSERSDVRTFYVVVLPPEILVPAPGGDLPRTGSLSGTGMPGAQVEVFLQGQAAPLLGPLRVRDDGTWEGTVTLDIGNKTLFARQTFDNKTSRDSPPQAFRVVPTVPSIETPATDEFVGRHAVVSGFGVPGDSVTVALAQAPQVVVGRTPVLEDRTWSVAVELDASSGPLDLIAVQWQGDFNSASSAVRTVNHGVYEPVIDDPAPGRWVADPVAFAGIGQPGVGSVVSWFDPDKKWQASIQVQTASWQGTASGTLPPGATWVRFQQTIAAPPTTSDWVESERFEVLPATPPAR